MSFNCFFEENIIIVYIVFTAWNLFLKTDILKKKRFESLEPSCTFFLRLPSMASVCPAFLRVFKGLHSRVIVAAL